MKKILMYLIILGILLLSIAGVSATDNATSVVGVEETNDEISESLINFDDLNDNFNSDSYFDESTMNSKENVQNNNEFNYSSDNGILMANGRESTMFVVPERFQDSFKILITIDSGSNIFDSFTYRFDQKPYKYSAYTYDKIYIPSDFKTDSFHTIYLYYEGNSFYKSCYQTFKFYYVKNGYSEFTCYWPKDTYFSVSSTAYGGINVELSSEYGKLDNILFKYRLDNNSKEFSTKNGIIPLNFEPNTYHTISLTYSGNSEYKTVTKIIKFLYMSSIKIQESRRYYVDGGMNIPYQILNYDGTVSRNTYSFASFGKHNITFFNNFNGEKITKEITVKKRILQTNDLTVDYSDMIEYKVRAANGNDTFTSGLSVSCILDKQTYIAKTDSEGYAVFKIHLKSGTHDVTTKYCGVVNKNRITVNSVYVSDKYKDIYINSINTYVGENDFVTYGWKGNFKGLLEIFDGQYLIRTINLDNSRYVGDYSYDKYSNSVSTSSLKEGVYVFKIVDKNDMVVTQSTVTIKKISTQVYGKNTVAYKNTKGLLYISLFDKRTGDGISGNVKIKLNGKTYNVYIKDGEGTLTFKALPNFKKYTGTIIYEGDINYESSYDKFVITVVKSVDSKIHVDSMSKIKPQSKIIVKAKVITDYGDNVNSGSVKFKINGITYKTKISNGVAKVKIKAPSKTRKYNCKAIYTGSKKIKSSSTSFSITVEPKYVDIEVPVAEGYTFAKYSGEYKVVSSLKVTYNSNTYLANISITPYKNNQVMQGLHSEFWIHEKSRGWIYLGYRVHGGDTSDVPKYNVLNVDKAKVRIHVY